MRISREFQQRLVTLIRGSFGDREIRLFGSRLNDNRKGGDYDIAVNFQESREAFRRLKIKFYAELVRQGLDLDVDLVQWNDDLDEILRKEIENNGVRIG